MDELKSKYIKEQLSQWDYVNSEFPNLVFVTWQSEGGRLSESEHNDLYDWLCDHGGERYIDWTSLSDHIGYSTHFFFKDPSIALAFKLKWS